MDRNEDGILAVNSLAVVTAPTVTTYQPLGMLFVESSRQCLWTTVAMAWITWRALVVGFAISGGAVAWTSDEHVIDLLEGHGAAEICYGSVFGFVVHFVLLAVGLVPSLESVQVAEIGIDLNDNRR